MIFQSFMLFSSYTVNRRATKLQATFRQLLRNLLLIDAGPFTCAQVVILVTNALAVQYLSIIFIMSMSC